MSAWLDTTNAIRSPAEAREQGAKGGVWVATFTWDYTTFVAVFSDYISAAAWLDTEICLACGVPYDDWIMSLTTEERLKELVQHEDDLTAYGLDWVVLDAAPMHMQRAA